MKILLDTNFLLIPNQFGVDIFEFLKHEELITLSSCVDELKKIGRSKSRDGLAARVAMQLIEKNNVKVIKTVDKGDKAIVNYAISNKCAVATNDKAMIKALKNKGIKIFRLRQKRYIVDE